MLVPDVGAKMGVTGIVKQFLEANDVAYQVFTYKHRCYRTVDILKVTPVPEWWVVKSIVVKEDGRFILAILQTRRWIEIARLKGELGNAGVRMAFEGELTGLFPECELGVVPPFGNLYGLEVWVDQPVTNNEKIVFKAGSHSETILINYKDFERLVRPKVAYFSGGKPWM